MEVDVEGDVGDDVDDDVEVEEVEDMDIEDEVVVGPLPVEDVVGRVLVVELVPPT